MKIKSSEELEELLNNWNGLEPLKINDSFFILPDNFTLENKTGKIDVVMYFLFFYVGLEDAWQFLLGE